MPYGPHAADDRARMLEAIGIDSVDALFEDIPEALRAGPLALDGPELVNSDPYGEGWMIRLRLADPADLDDLLDADAYAEQLGA